MSRASSLDGYFKREAAASGVAMAVLSSLSTFGLLETGEGNIVLAGSVLVGAARVLHWMMLRDTVSAGAEAAGSSQYEAFDATPLDRILVPGCDWLSLFAVPAGYAAASELGLETAKAHCFAGGVAGTVAIGVLYRVLRPPPSEPRNSIL